MPSVSDGGTKTESGEETCTELLTALLWKLLLSPSLAEEGIYVFFFIFISPIISRKRGEILIYIVAYILEVKATS